MTTLLEELEKSCKFLDPKNDDRYESIKTKTKEEKEREKAIKEKMDNAKNYSSKAIGIEYSKLHVQERILLKGYKFYLKKSENISEACSYEIFRDNILNS